MKCIHLYDNKRIIMTWHKLILIINSIPAQKESELITLMCLLPSDPLILCIQMKPVKCLAFVQMLIQQENTTGRMFLYNKVKNWL